MVRRKYDQEFKLMIVELLQSGVPAKQIELEYQLSANMVRRWRRENELRKDNSIIAKKQLSADEKELKDLRKQLREVTLERDILKKAVGIFSKSDR